MACVNLRHKVDFAMTQYPASSRVTVPASSSLRAYIIALSYALHADCCCLSTPCLSPCVAPRLLVCVHYRHVNSKTGLLSNHTWIRLLSKTGGSRGVLTAGGDEILAICHHRGITLHFKMAGSQGWDLLGERLETYFDSTLYVPSEPFQTLAAVGSVQRVDRKLPQEYSSAILTLYRV